jgi:histidyl-tRNA synthetase
MSTLKAVRGTRDLLPPETELWNRVEATARRVFARYNFGEIRTPIFEDTQLFARGVGEETDIVSKEMYTWEDRARAASEKAQSLTLRPENTAGVVRAYIEHKLGETGLLQKLFYIGPQFRRERPQRGRYRQFVQIGAEVIGPVTAGSESPLRDAEVLEMLATLLGELGIAPASAEQPGWRLAINSVGSAADRPRYIAALREALATMAPTLCGDCQQRAHSNPLRVLDCKVPEDQAAIDALPKIADFLDTESKAHFAAVCAALDGCGVAYTVNPRLVRGLDYYSRTTFEFTHDAGLGTQNALLGGGRYDGLSEMLGGPKAPGIGFAIGADRLVLTLQSLQGETPASKADAFIAPIGEAQAPAAAGLRVELGDGSWRLKKSFETADKIAKKIVLVGEDEVASGMFTVKDFASGEQRKVARAELGSALSKAQREPRIVPIYVRLLGERTEVSRPTQAQVLEDGTFLLLSTSDYDPNDERWEFLPGTRVKARSCSSENDEYLLAVHE